MNIIEKFEKDIEKIANHKGKLIKGLKGAYYDCEEIDIIINDDIEFECADHITITDKWIVINKEICGVDGGVTLGRLKNKIIKSYKITKVWD